jgi:proteasome lid subunit RPN8/RPN11
VLRLAPDALRAITAHAERDYPREACGVLLGRLEGERRVATSARPAGNLNTERAHDRYDMDPKDRLAAEAEGRARGEAVVGFYHSHPDHDAYFSATDLARSEEAQWGEPWVPPAYAYLVVSVRGGRLVARKAFLVVEGASVEVLVQDP